MLYVEDDDATAYLFTVALNTAGMGPRFYRVKDGEQALQFLLQQGAYNDAPQPDLVLLDLHLPIKNGFDVLTEIKNIPRLQDIPVVVFSTSTRDHDRERSLQLGAVDYLRKADGLANFLNVVQNICQRLAVQSARLVAKTQATH